jgi:periplasmic protein TonB
MLVEARKTSEENLGVLRGCLVEGDPEQRLRERRNRRRSLAISIALQSLVIAAIVLVPILAKTEHIVMAHEFVPIPPYRPYSRPSARPAPQQPQPAMHPCFTCPLRPVTEHPLPNAPATPNVPGIEDPFPGGPNPGPVNPNGLINLNDARLQPEKPHEPPPERPKRLSTQLDPAMLVRRVEPIYPTPPRQMGRSGHVELRAIISIDGSIQSLQVVRGDPLFYQSALDAVRQWRYRPTVLNGQPVEIDTYITVEYTMQH